jgi:hypothetical protein
MSEEKKVLHEVKLDKSIIKLLEKHTNVPEINLLT